MKGRVLEVNDKENMCHTCDILKRVKEDAPALWFNGWVLASLNALV